MTKPSRRDILKGSLAAGMAWGLPRLLLGEGRAAAGPNSEVRMAIVGLGGIKTVGGVGGRGRQILSALQRVAGVKVVALCDVDQTILDHGLQLVKDQHPRVSACTDLRKLLDDKTIDAVAIATPNHWHALATVWACQAGKDVYVEKPFSYNLWEGRQMVAAARKHGRMVQVGTQRRSSATLRAAFDYLHSGAIGPIRCAHAIVYRPRRGIGKAGKPTPVPSTIDYDLWCGPAPKTPLARKQLHYDWHWVWPTGNGEIGNNGVHAIDVCRWALRQDGPPPRAMSLGGRFAFHDDGETPNTQIALFDYQPAPLICEIRNLSAGKRADAVGRFRAAGRFMLVDCEGGYMTGDMSGVAVFDGQGKKVREIREKQSTGDVEVAHLANFMAAVRTRNAASLNTEAAQGHFSASCSHMANVSYHLGKQVAPGVIQETIRSQGELSDAFDRCREHLRANGVDLELDRAVLGPWVTLDAAQGRFAGQFAEQANALSQRSYRKPFVVPEIT